MKNPISRTKHTICDFNTHTHTHINMKHISTDSENRRKTRDERTVESDVVVIDLRFNGGAKNDV